MLNYHDQLAVRRNIVERCTALVVSYAKHLLGLQESTESQKAWARGAMRSPHAAGEEVSYYAISETEFVNNGSGISDATLQTIVQNAINNHFIEPMGA